MCRPAIGLVLMAARKFGLACLVCSTGMSGAAALARAAEQRAKALESRPATDVARVEELHARAETHGAVEKTVGDSGVVGTLRRKWERWLLTEHGRAVAERLKSGGSPTIEEVKRFSSYTYCNREVYSCVGREGCGDSYGLLQIPYMLAKQGYISRAASRACVHVPRVRVAPRA